MIGATDKRNKWWCPLLCQEIAEGYCIDINNERLGYFKTGTLELIKSITHKSSEDISSVCEKCPNMPL